MLSNQHSKVSDDILKYYTLHSEYVNGVKNHFHEQNISTKCMFCPLNTTRLQQIIK